MKADTEAQGTLSPIFDLMRDFPKDDAFNQQDRTLCRYLNADLLIIDDMGVRSLRKHSGEYLIEVIMRWHENRSSIMTSKRPLEDWGKLLAHMSTAGTILSRFLHHAQVVVTPRPPGGKGRPPTAEDPAV